MSRLQISQVFIQFFSYKSRSASKVFVSTPSLTQSEHYGTLFGIIEINTPNKENPKIISLITDFLEHFYYSSAQSTDVLARFEETLQKTNEYFEQLLETQATLLMGTLTKSTFKQKVNFAVGVIIDKDLHLCANSGITSLLLYRTNQEFKSVSIVEQDEDNSPKLFTSVVSGECAPGNYLFFSNANVNKHITTERIVKTVTSLPVNKAADYLKNSLLGFDGFNFSAIIISNPKPETLSTSHNSMSTISSLNKKEADTEKLLSSSLLPNINTSLEHFSGIIKSKFQKSSTRPQTESHPTTKTSSTVTQEFEKLKTKTKQYSPTINWSAFSQSKFVLSIALMLKKLQRSVINAINNLPSFTKLLTALFIIVMIGFGYSLYRSNPQAIPAFIEQFGKNEELAALETALTDVEAKVIVGDLATAQTLLTDIEAKLPTVKVSHNSDQQKLEQLNLTFNNLVAKIRKITLINDPILVTTITNATKEDQFVIGQYKDELILINKDSGKEAYSFNTVSKNISSLTKSWSAEILNATTINNALYALSANNTIHALSGNTFTSYPVPSSAQITDITYYNDRLYSLTPSVNQLSRHATVGGAYQSGITWIQESGVSISDAVGLSIDTRVWVALKNGVVKKLFKGYTQAFALEQIQPPLTTIDDFTKNENSTNLYILDKEQKRVIVFNEDGALITQYYSSQISRIDSMYVNELAKTVYVTSGNEVYALFMTHLNN
ncbi:hypothetical protein IT409_00275 [Candidatus Falkowbacteria bacterium]|nr:hypothetical protein [Candidatus Falkowbacteria bacterium]